MEPHPLRHPPQSQPRYRKSHLEDRCFVGPQTGFDSPELPTAVLVFHGIGEEVRFETLSRAASLILTEAKERKATDINVVIRSVPRDDKAAKLEVRSELSWTEANGTERIVDVYDRFSPGRRSRSVKLRMLRQSAFLPPRAGTACGAQFFRNGRQLLALALRRFSRA